MKPTDQITAYPKAGLLRRPAIIGRTLAPSALIMSTLLLLAALPMPAQTVPQLLGIQSSDGQISVFWPSGLSLVQPQKNTNVVFGTWSDFGVATTANSLTVTPNSPAAFYRLRFLGPNITEPPKGQTNAVGSDVTFTVGASGTAPMAYQWHKDNVALAGQTNMSLFLANASTNDAGHYTVVVTNFVGSVISSVAVLSVTNALVRPAGIYMGSFNDGAPNTGFGVMLRSNGMAYLIGYTYLSLGGVFKPGFPVAPDGSFKTTTLLGDEMGGVFTASNVSGSIPSSVLGVTAEFSGSRKSDIGVHANDAGYYSGSFSGDYTGDLYMIAAADGTAFVYYRELFFGAEGSGYGTITASNSFSAQDLEGFFTNTTLTGTLDQSTHVLSGSYSLSGITSGTFSLTRRLTP